MIYGAQALTPLKHGFMRLNKTYPLPCKLPAVWVLLIFATLLSGCDRVRLFEDQITLEENRWNTGDFVRFTFQVPDTESPCNLYLTIRNTTDYSYSNLYLLLHTILPDSTVAADTLDLPLATVDGKWLGRGNGKYRDSRILIRSGFRFPVAGTYHLEIEQAMREQELTGISAIGLRIEKPEK